ncbi:HAD family hydrolase [Zhihengliuella halotolerans]|uniref:HAD superfamily hydrolase (TIGR01509 family) n=1 Tax=Zhihengliuella halotolerans TaxID=370736 RepID=A0A4Q8AB80_9MICC|nr:HAD family hydrolase [Zhihengliuella halotolerans]RZU61412.1 HAD superfamily hydrolase (TIGR01509 family) [Zhihengliuella halotolerans]
MPSTDSAVAATANRFDPSHGLQAVLWDMDGTIVDTEPYWIRAEKDLVHGYGCEWTHEDAMRLVGNALPVSAAMIRDAIVAGGGPSLEIRHIVDTLSHEVMSSVRRAIPWRPGARELLEQLAAAGVPCALVTMSEGPLAGLVVDALPPGTMRFKVTGDMVQRGKPHPEPYLQGLERMGDIVPGLEARRVVAIEDSVPGVASAAASGSVTIAVPHFIELPPPENWTEWETLAGRTADDLDALVRSLPASGGTTA